MSVRLAIGGSRWRLVRQLLAESAVLSILGVAAGLRAGGRDRAVIVEPVVHEHHDSDARRRARLAPMLFATGVACLVTPLFAILPALNATRVEPGAAMKEQSRTMAGDGVHAARAGAGSRSDRDVAGVGGARRAAGRYLHAAGNCVHWDSRAGASWWPTCGCYPMPSCSRSGGPCSSGFGPSSSDVPGVDTTALATKVPVSGSGWNSGVVDVDGTDVGGDGRQRMVWASGVSDGFFATYGIAIRAGRDFSPSDTVDAPRVMIVNEAFVRRFIGSGSAIGRRVREGAFGRPDTYSEYREIVGVVADTVYRQDLRRDFEPTVFVPLGQLEGPPRESITVAARSRGGEADDRWSQRSPGRSRPRTRG